MVLKKESTSTDYLPVQWEHRELIEEHLQKQTSGKIFYFCTVEGICVAEGAVKILEDVSNEGMFLTLESGKKIRIDRIITLFGKPGAAYDEYDAYANACMDCMGGYEKGELN
jgi:hypothetical protein